MKSIIEIKDLKVMARHGVLATEKKYFQPFILDVQMYTNFLRAAKSDNLNDTISYCDVMKDLYDYIVSTSFNLIETLAYNCALLLLKKYPQIDRIYLSISKPEAPYDKEFKTVKTHVDLSWHKAYLSLGSNLGNREKYLKDAIKMLNDLDEINVVKESSLYKNPPYGGVATKEFVNQAIEIDTLFDPFDLLDKIHEIEKALGRKRTVHWGDRTIDIDIIFYDDLKLNTKDLTIPHKDYKNRDFVIVPLSEIAPHLF